MEVSGIFKSQKTELFPGLPGPSPRKSLGFKTPYELFFQ